MVECEGAIGNITCALQYAEVNRIRSIIVALLMHFTRINCGHSGKQVAQLPAKNR